MIYEEIIQNLIKQANDTESLKGLKVDKSEIKSGKGMLILSLNERPLLRRDYDESELPEHYRKEPEISYKAIVSVLLMGGVNHLKNYADERNII